MDPEESLHCSLKAVCYRLTTQKPSDLCVTVPVLWRGSPICPDPEAATSEEAPSALSVEAAAWSPPQTESRSPPDGTNTHQHIAAASGHVTESELVDFLGKHFFAVCLFKKKKKKKDKMFFKENQMASQNDPQ